MNMNTAYINFERNKSSRVHRVLYLNMLLSVPELSITLIIYIDRVKINIANPVIM